ncbi:antigen 5 like allergen Cul n 1 isoform X2 [Drosophila teissieri]|uniref:antigen 5 like allergen Cul n 1 isoform X2 n=1 Tax=Drosophila teissieri TaxID=7243 RepID=UPI001CBA402F|nr:antigen 5 like allergen Cul n 1 isoform X2 [Drosophila teissieri]
MSGYTVVNIFVLSLVLQSLAENLCRQDLCPKGTTHIACNVNASFGSSCPKDASVIKLNLKDKKLLLRAHNLVRQKWASGKAKIRRPACKMAKIEWSKELEKLALLNAKTCVVAHDGCHNTEQFRQSGQNLFVATYSLGMNVTSAVLLETAVAEWAGEEKDIAAEDLQKFDANKVSSIGHLTVLVNERSSAVGCGLVSYKRTQFKQYYLACNYAYTNVVGEPVYGECAKAGSGCPKGIDPIYAPLCVAL